METMFTLQSNLACHTYQMTKQRLMPIRAIGQVCQAISVFWNHQKVHWSLGIDVPVYHVLYKKAAKLKCKVMRGQTEGLATYLKASAVSSSNRIVAGICFETILSNKVSSPCSAF